MHLEATDINVKRMYLYCLSICVLATVEKLPIFSLVVTLSQSS